jgi:hypothetical protein
VVRFKTGNLAPEFEPSPLRIGSQEIVMAITDDRYLLSDLQHYRRNRSLLYLELRIFQCGVEGTVRQIVSPELICGDCQRRADVRSQGENTGAESVLLMETFI